METLLRKGIFLARAEGSSKKELLDKITKKLVELEKQGIKIQTYWTLGRYDGISIIEVPTEKDVMKMLIPWVDVVDLETRVVPREEAIKLL